MSQEDTCQAAQLQAPMGLLLVVIFSHLRPCFLYQPEILLIENNIKMKMTLRRLTLEPQLAHSLCQIEISENGTESKVDPGGLDEHGKKGGQPKEVVSRKAKNASFQQTQGQAVCMTCLEQFLPQQLMGVFIASPSIFHYPDLWSPMTLKVKCTGIPRTDKKDGA